MRSALRAFGVALLLTVVLTASAAVGILGALAFVSR